MNCSKCNNPLLPNAKFCAECATPASKPEEKSVELKDVVIKGDVVNIGSSFGVHGGSAAPALEVCPICGRKNTPDKTFLCRKCGRDNICVNHQDEESFWCRECARAGLRDTTQSASPSSESSPAVHSVAPQSVKVWIEEMTGMEFLWVSGGTFMMGSESNEASDNEKPSHSVAVDGFWLGKYLVTQREWEMVMGENPSTFKDNPQAPIETVSFEDISDFIAELKTKGGIKFRLPTEAEWEYACRGGSTDDRYGNLDRVAWVDKNSGNRPHSVGQKRPNDFGLYDMLGNVWEWCSDWYDADYYKKSPSNNPEGSRSGAYRVIRGGCWDNDAQYARASYRYFYDPSRRVHNLGFRLARD